jgi:hypothetical protein
MSGLDVLQVFWEERMQSGRHDFDIWREHQGDLLREAEAQQLARVARPDWREHLGKYHSLLERFSGKILGLGKQVVPSHRAFPPDEEVAPSGTVAGLVGAQVRSSSVIELHQEEKGYVIREVDLGTGNHILYLSTEEPEWATWIWELKTHP